MADKFLDRVAGREQQKTPATTSAGAADGGRIVALDPTTGQIDPSMIAGAETRTMTAFENISAGGLVNVFLSSGSVKMRNADATAAGKETTGFVLDAVLAGATTRYYENGVISGLSGLTLGARYYLSKTTPGALLATPLSSSGGVTGNVDQFVGWALSATELQYDPEEGTILA